MEKVDTFVVELEDGTSYETHASNAKEALYKAQQKGEKVKTVKNKIDRDWLW